ncbi:alpha/beta fold hydrolase [Paraburkholderia terrae]|uniref:alpha/beta fold hydrolase n=1 Tax=Paraburkholderia TaxID=1822464 RepID=UPI001EE334E0|nr:alpha/beta fold hydrolase [Paraburkholderia terrae]BEU21200.1 alpha/beta fold hydrolase [Paraburkholderia sp. 22B1P]GJH06763.1 alpha/beta fold hydrolase [Paraburkholderia terrae]
MKRRSFMSHLFASGAGLAMSGGVRAECDKVKPTFVFVHGAWHGGWCWSEVIRLLSQQGYTGITLDLPGHGLRAEFPSAYTATPQNTAGLSTEVSPLASIRLIEYRDHVLGVIRGLVENGTGPVILVGHSLGGVTLNAVAEAQPALIRRLVYLTAFVPVAKPTVLDYLSQPNFVASQLPALFFGNPASLGAARINPNSPDPTYIASMRQALYLDVQDSVVAAAMNMLTPDEPLHGLSDPATVSVGHWGSVPRSFIRCLNDHAIPLAGQDQMIAEGNELTPHNRFTVKTLDSSHSAFLAHPGDVTKALLDML